MNKDKLVEKLIKCIPDVNKPGEKFITVAELSTNIVDGLIETIDVNTAIISSSLLSKIKASHANPFVKTTGVNYDKEFVYTPSNWLYVSPSSGLKKAEPLVASWKSENNTILALDQGFLSTFDLSPRLINDEIYWDDLSRPQYEIVQNKLVSKYEYPKFSEAYVRIDKSYLEDYLYLRKKTAVLVFTIIKDIYLDPEILLLLGEKDHYIEEFKQYEIRISKFDNKEDIARLEINGYKPIFENNDNLEEKEDIPIGHYWKGIEGLVTNWRARHEMPFTYIYVLDEVLGKYEDNDDYEIYPQFGSVKYKTQWAVSHCERIGRNGIKIEVKKLYEGTPYEVIEFWNKFSIDFSEIAVGENIAKKAERLTKQYFLFGRLLSKAINKICNFSFVSSDIITLDEKAIEYTGWTDFPDYRPITNHIDFQAFSKEQFISRCKKLNILLIENLKENPLRKAVNNLGFSTKDTEKLKGLKLLELILKYLYIVQESGLDPLNQKETIIERSIELKEFNVLSELFALNAIRQLDAHKSGDTDLKLHTALKYFGIEKNSITNNYANTCERVYDKLFDVFNNVNISLLGNM